MKYKSILPFAIAVFSLVTPFVARAEEEAAHHGGLPQFDPSSWASQIFWMAVFFVALYTIFSQSVLPALGETIQSRHDFIQGEIKKAEELSQEAQLLKESLAAELRMAGNAAAQAVRDAEGAVKQQTEEAGANFRVRFEDIMTASDRSIAEAADKARADMDKVAAELATIAAEKIAGIQADSKGAESVVKNLSGKLKVAA